MFEFDKEVKVPFENMEEVIKKIEEYNNNKVSSLQSTVFPQLKRIKIEHSCTIQDDNTENIGFPLNFDILFDTRKKVLYIEYLGNEEELLNEITSGVRISETRAKNDYKEKVSNTINEYLDLIKEL